jgi:uncharacterized protein
MSMADPILISYRAALDDLYGDRIERVVLYGSRARGDATPGSDYDIALFLRELDDLWGEIDRLGTLQNSLFDTMGAEVHTLLFPEGRWRDGSPLMFEVRKDGVDL